MSTALRDLAFGQKAIDVREKKLRRVWLAAASRPVIAYPALLCRVCPSRLRIKKKGCALKRESIRPRTVSSSTLRKISLIGRES
jgi:hypothetical protein